MKAKIDLNADLGEGCGTDDELLPLVTSCSIACGGHTGDAASMKETVSRAMAAGVAIGAHPSYPDREGFGRRSRFLDGTGLRDSLIEQVTALAAVVDQAGVTLRHVKPHGALYNDAAIDAELATVVVEAIRESVGDVAIMGPPASALRVAATAAGLRYLCEGFADRRYRSDGSLAPRTEPGAVIEDADLAVRQALLIAGGEPLATTDDGSITLAIDTLCLHGDSKNAVAIATAIRGTLYEKGFSIRAG